MYRAGGDAQIFGQLALGKAAASSGGGDQLPDILTAANGKGWSHGFDIRLDINSDDI